MKVLLLFCFASLSALAQSPGSIPLDFMANPAKDLYNIEKQATYSRSELLKLKKTGVDLSKIDPKKTDIWDNISQDVLSAELDDLGYSENKIYDYVDEIDSPIGVFRFSIRGKKNLSVWVAKDSRSVLLRKNLLRKLGYKSPKTKHVDKLQIKFRGMVSLNDFVKQLEVNTFANTARWLVHKNEESFILTLQDVIVVESNFLFFNLTTGEIPESVIDHRRSLNSLVIPFAVTDLRESVDGLLWNVGRVDNNQLLIDTIGADQYTTTADDAKWILRKMAKLTESDYSEIIAASYFPQSVGLLLKEKLKSRFLSLYNKFDLPKSEVKHLSVKTNISDKSGELVKGRLTKDSWSGHAANYSFDDTESPLSKAEIGAYFRSKLYSSIISNLATYFNDNFLYDTDIQSEAIQQQINAQRNQILGLLQTGELKRIPFSTWAIPTARGNISVSRDIVTGSYLGTDNRIQIADSLEFIGGVGVFVGTTGMNPQYTAYLKAGAQFSRSYTHVKAIKSMKKALKEPYRNLLVPRVKRQKGKTLQDIIEQLQTKEFQELEPKEKEEKLTEILNGLKEVLSVGESFIISNNLVFSGSVAAGVTYKIADAIVGLDLNRINISRTHIVRISEDVIQIYKSKAKSFGHGYNLEISVFIPVITLRSGTNRGKIRTMFNSISINRNQETDELIRNLTEFKQILTSSSTELLEARKKPFFIDHKFKEKSFDSSFFYNKAINLKLTDNIKITHPEGFETDLIVRSTGRLMGKDYQQVAIDILNGLIEEVTDQNDVELDNPSSGNPGDSYKGSSYSRLSTYEEPLNLAGTEVPFKPYTEIKHQWKGWRAGANQLNKIRKFIKAKYGEDVFNDDMFAGTNEIQLYSVDVGMSIYDKGIEKLLSYDYDFFKKVIDNQLEIPTLGRVLTPRQIRRLQGKPRYEQRRATLIRKLLRAYKRLRPDRRYVISAKQRAEDIEFVSNTSEMMLPFDLFSKLIGGKENFYLSGVINGFRVGVEDGEESIISNSIGEYGSEFVKGTFNTLREAIKISQGELGAYWFLRRLQ